MNLRAYLVDLGFLLDEKDKEFDFYSCVYDRKYGYYDENQYYVTTLEEAKKDSIAHINKNINNNPYAVVSITEVPEDFDLEDGVSNEEYRTENIVFDACVENGKIKENFVVKQKTIITDRKENNK
jgi:hypothetical protein